MDILIMIIILVLFYRVIIKEKNDKKSLVLWAVSVVLILVLFKLHATSTLNISL